MFFDPIYWIVIGIGTLLSLWASFKVKSTFSHFSQFATRSGLRGFEVAQRILHDHGIHDVNVEPVMGSLTDHYDPTTKTLRLSESVYYSESMAALGVAAHEVGHAIQHAQGYSMLKLRSNWVPLANTGSGLSIFILIGALMVGGAATPLGSALSLVGVLLFSCTTIFTFITLPVEFDASKRALMTLEQGGYMNSDELHGARKVLNAAALTYVAAFVTSLLTLLYWVFRLGLLGQRGGDE